MYCLALPMLSGRSAGASTSPSAGPDSADKEGAGAGTRLWQRARQLSICHPTSRTSTSAPASTSGRLLLPFSTLPSPPTESRLSAPTALGISRPEHKAQPTTSMRSVVMVPVLSKHTISSCPAGLMRAGLVQYMRSSLHHALLVSHLRAGRQQGAATGRRCQFSPLPAHSAPALRSHPTPETLTMQTASDLDSLTDLQRAMAISRPMQMAAGSAGGTAIVTMSQAPRIRCLSEAPYSLIFAL